MPKLIDLQTSCPNCGDSKQFNLDYGQWLKWQEGYRIQVVFPNLSLDDCERLKTGICPKCWDNMFGEDEPEWDGPEPAA